MSSVPLLAPSPKADTTAVLVGLHTANPFRRSICLAATMAPGLVVVDMTIERMEMVRAEQAAEAGVSVCSYLAQIRMGVAALSLSQLRSDSQTP
jgi:hypothetical protein